METFLAEIQNIKSVLKNWNISVLDKVLEEKLAIYYRELVAYNEKINLIANPSLEEIAWRHFLDSLAGLLAIEAYSKYPSPYPLPQGEREKQRDFQAKLIDVGSGAGFPGLVLKIARPTLQVTLLEATQKKCEFLNHLIKLLNLSDIEVIWGRAENLGKNPDYREKFVVATSRALANLSTANELCLPFLDIGGIFIAQKGKDVDSEIKTAEKSLKILGGKLEKILPYSIKEKSYNLIVIKKIFPTPIQYPRREGIPQKKPLI